jgi:hypothetical protein
MRDFDSSGNVGRGIPRAGRFAGWSRVVATVLAAAAPAVGAVSCGGSGGAVAKPMVLTGFQFVDRSLTPSFPTNVQSLPRNAIVVFEFSDLVDPATVDEQTIQIRFGSQFQSVPRGSFQIDGNRVLFDPTVTVQGQPNPNGLDPVTQYNIELPAQGMANSVVSNLDRDPLLAPYLTHFVTSDGFLRELVPPEVVDVTFSPAPDPVTHQIPGNGVLVIKFSEAIDPASMTLATNVPAPLAADHVDVRYVDLPTNPNVNFNDGLENVPIPGSFTYDASQTTFFFKPTFSFGTKKYVFAVTLFQGVTDLAGNLLVNPRSFGPYTCDATGIANGKVLTEQFQNQTDNDTLRTTADWGTTESGFLLSADITSRRAFVTGFQQVQATGGAGRYRGIYEVLVGADLNTYYQGLTPPTAAGRRVMWAFKDTEIGAPGSVTVASWGPDSNVTFAAKYPEVTLRIGFQKTASMSLAPSFSGNYLGSPLIVYKGVYDVKQNAAVPNEITPLPVNNWSAQFNPLFQYTGFVDWPTLTSYFDWDEGDAAVAGDRVLIFDAGVQEGDSWNQIRGWLAHTSPTDATWLSGYPTRRMFAAYEEDVPNPPSDVLNGILNPEPSLTDTAFTITVRKTVAQTKFYTPPSGDPALNPAGPPTPPFSTQTTYGKKSDFLTPQVVPAVQAGGASILLEFQGANALDVSGNRGCVLTDASETSGININFPYTPFTNNINDCDTYPYFRWRLTCISNLVSGTKARVDRVTIPILQLP